MKRLATILVLFMAFFACSSAYAGTSDNKSLVIGLINKILVTAPHLTAAQVMSALKSTLDSLGVDTSNMDMSGGVNGIASQLPAEMPLMNSLLSVISGQGISTLELSGAAKAIGISSTGSGSKKLDRTYRDGMIVYNGTGSKPADTRSDNTRNATSAYDQYDSGDEGPDFGVYVDDMIDDAIDAASDAREQSYPAGGNDDNIDSNNNTDPMDGALSPL